MEKWEIIFVFGKETSSSKKFHLLITFSSGVSLNNKFNLTKFRNITSHNECIVSNYCITLILYRNLSNPPKLWTLRHFGSHASTTNNPCEELGTTGSTQFFAGFVRTALSWWPALTSRNSDQSQHGLDPVLYGPQFGPISDDLSWIWFVTPHGFVENTKKGTFNEKGWDLCHKPII